MKCIISCLSELAAVKIGMIQEVPRRVYVPDHKISHSTHLHGSHRRLFVALFQQMQTIAVWALAEHRHYRVLKLN